ncbi:MAG: peptide chain release factor N(5)-glutamine methyltransferase [Syntrophobacteraceae bacterium]
MEGEWTILKVLQWTANYFSSKGISQPRSDAEVLLSYTLGVERIQLYLNYDKPLSPAELARFKELIRRRAASEPTQYIIGKQEFWSLEFEVTRDVLIPRPETEILVEKALEMAGTGRALALDIGTGSGAIAVSLAHERPEIEVVATDRSFAAILVAKRNATRHAVSNRISFVRMDLMQAIAPVRQFDLIVSNPPYIGETELLDLAPEIANYEPRSALEGGGRQGLGLIRKILRQYRYIIRPGGSLLIEIGQGQAEILEKELTSRFEFIPDYAGIKRVLHVWSTGG